MTPQKDSLRIHQVCKIDYCNKFLTEITNLDIASKVAHHLESHKSIPKEHAT
jgi:hypothetical protein